MVISANVVKRGRATIERYWMQWSHISSNLIIIQFKWIYGALRALKLPNLNLMFFRDLLSKKSFYRSRCNFHYSLLNLFNRWWFLDNTICLYPNFMTLSLLISSYFIAIAYLSDITCVVKYLFPIYLLYMTHINASHISAHIYPAYISHIASLVKIYIAWFEPKGRMNLPINFLKVLANRL